MAKKRLRITAFAFLFILLVAFFIGFLTFTRAANMPEAPPQQPGDGIVVLTGGTSRIRDALKLLADGYGKRLLVSGVHPATSRHDLAHMMGEDGYLVECCVDLDYEAVNTVGNAVETRKWAQINGFTSLLIVTSNYHMPRTLIEMHREFPQATFIPMPIESAHVQMQDWWLHFATVRLLLLEYVKYLWALLRSALTFVS